MKKLNGILKLSAFILFIMFLTSCNKDKDPTASYTPREAGLIKDWLAKVKLEKLHLDSTTTGIYYIADTTKVGSGPTVSTGKTVTVKYNGMFTDGNSFDSSPNYTYIHKDKDPNKRMIQGWEEGIEVLRKGDRATFLFPSTKGYGPKGYSIIPPNTPLIFIIEVVDIK